MTPREEVYAAIDGERRYQFFRATEVGDTEEHQHSLEEWAIYIESYLDEMKESLARVWRHDGKPNLNELNILRKITAMGVAAMEQHGAPRREGF